MAAFPSDKHGFSQTGLVGAVGVGLVAALTAMPLWASDQDNTRATARSERQESRAAASSERASSAPSSSAPSIPSTTPQSTPSYSAPSSGSSSGASSSSEPSTPVYTRGTQAPQRSESSPSAGRGGSVYIHEGGNGSTPSVQVASDRGGRDGGRDRGGRGNGGRDRDRHRGGHRGGHHGGGIYIGGYGGGYGGYGYYPGYCRWCWGGYPWGGGTIIVQEGGGGYGYGRNTGALDLDVAPERAEVYINGDYAGRADDYDGWPAFLWLEAGTYDIVLYHEGYRTIARQYTVRPGVVIDIQDEMQPGDAVRPEDLPSRSTVNRDERVRRNEERDAEVTQRERDAERRSAREASSDRPETEQAVGRIYLSLWPDDAAVYLDGHFLGTAGEISQLSAGLVVEPGEHRLEVVHPGFKTEQRTVNVPSGERVEVKFDLTEN